MPVGVELAADEIPGQELGVLPVEGAVFVAAGDDGDYARPEVRVRQAQVPGRVAANGMTAEEHPIGVDRKAPRLVEVVVAVVVVDVRAPS